MAHEASSGWQHTAAALHPCLKCLVMRVHAGSPDNMYTIEFEEPSGANPLVEMMLQVGWGGWRIGVWTPAAAHCILAPARHSDAQGMTAGASAEVKQALSKGI